MILKRTDLFFQHTLSKSELIQISIEIKQRNSPEQDELFLQQL